MSKPVCTLPFSYDDTPERRVLNLEDDAITCVPALGYSHYTQSRPSVSEHLHPGCLELTLCMRGSLVFECGQAECRVLPGNVFVTQPDEWHRLSTNPKGLVMYWMFFRLEGGARPLLHLPVPESDALKESLRGLPRRLFPGSDRMRFAFQRLFRLRDELPAGSFRTLSLRGTVLELLLALVEAARAAPVCPEDGRVKRLIDAMRAHPERDYPADHLIREAALSESRLNTRFKQLTGLPPYTFLLTCRLRAAQQLLREGDEPVTAIAQALGFSTSQHFAMQFKREFGVTPSAWRTSARAGVDAFQH
ncbi:MAG: AraC family transcriptional regulator [Kiritimatiellia bacterium]